ncbi:MAG: polysaccharide biosynthesis/export family protein [Fimbriimonadaceae bacterium]|nr:polysaccharide biosynthesis/export family protein [Fimbriimonadaceae bacterium]QYK56396.1 MAG: polysaccharide biosynthesis/export family protein [Fimbriimonadaceae bacterium]
MRKVVVLVTTLLFVLLSVATQAQTQSGTYRLRIEDVLRIQVFDENQILAEVSVTPDGNITAPFVGPLRAEGKTTVELEQDLHDLYEAKLRLRNPIVSVVLLRVRPVLVAISGAVERPNMYQVRPGDRVLQVLTQAGAIPNTADLRRARYRKKNWTEWVPLDLRSLLFEGSSAQNYVVDDGDEIYVPLQENSFIGMFGEVRTPGPVAYIEGMTVMRAIILANGEIPNRSKLSGTMILRRKPGTTNEFIRINCNLVAFVRKGDVNQDVVLQPGDIVYVPNNGNPNFELLSALSNAVFILERFGLDLFGTRP